VDAAPAAPAWLPREASVVADDHWAQVAAGLAGLDSNQCDSALLDSAADDCSVALVPHDRYAPAVRPDDWVQYSTQDCWAGDARAAVAHSPDDRSAPADSAADGSAGDDCLVQADWAAADLAAADLAEARFVLAG